MPSCFKLSSALLLAAMCFLIAEVVSAEQMTTCDSDGFVVHRLNCDYGVINVQQALYGRSSSLVCSDGRPPQQLANTQCERQGTTDDLSSRCNGKKTCVVNTDAFRNPDPCFGTFKYLQTNFTCLPAITVVACEESLAHLFCDVGQVISVYGADYGRRDRTTCIYKRPESQIQNVDCLRPTELVASRCDGENSCTVAARNNVFGDPCVGTYKYLEVAYTCVYPETTKTSSSTL